MPGRRSSAGRAWRVRTSSLSQIQWRHATATEVAEAGALEISGGNGYIDPNKAIAKLKVHGAGLWGMQMVVAFVMAVIAIISGERSGGKERLILHVALVRASSNNVRSRCMF